MSISLVYLIAWHLILTIYACRHASNTALINALTDNIWRWTIDGDGVIALATEDEEAQHVLSIEENTSFPPAAGTDLYLYESEGESWMNTWKVISPIAVLSHETGSEDQAWKAEFVDPYINYALLPGKK